MNESTKPLWLALIVPAYALGWPMFIPLGQRVQTYRNWAKRRGLQILGEHATEQQARAQIAKVAKARQSFFDGSKKIINREKRKQRLELKQARIPGDVTNFV